MCALAPADMIAPMSDTTLVSISDQLADAVAVVAPSVVQVQGRRRPASGVVYGSDVVLTTVRALGREDGLRVRTHDGRELDAELAGWDPATGLAVVRAAGLNVAAAAVTDRPARVGHLAIAVARQFTRRCYHILRNLDPDVVYAIPT